MNDATGIGECKSACLHIPQDLLDLVLGFTWIDKPIYGVTARKADQENDDGNDANDLDKFHDDEVLLVGLFLLREWIEFLKQGICQGNRLVNQGVRMESAILMAE